MIGREARQLVVAMSVLCIVMPGAPSFAQPVDVWGAAAGGDLETVRGVLDAGGDPDALEPNGATPIIVAAMFGHADLVDLLIERKATLDVQNNDGATALHVAALFGHPDAITALLGAGASTNIRNQDGLTALGLVRALWTDEMYALYGYLGATFQMDLDIERIRKTRPAVRTVLQGAD
jgi:ankyrin repeat protein